MPAASTDQNQPITPTPQPTQTSPASPSSIPTTPTQKVNIGNITPAASAKDTRDQQLANTAKEPSLIDKFKIYTHISTHKLVALVLAIQGLFGLYKSVSFILVEYPKLEEALLLDQITQLEINAYANHAILMVVSTVISMFFALRLAVIQTKWIQRLGSFFGALLFIGNTYVQNFLTEVHSTNVLTDLLLRIVRAVRVLFY